MFKNAYGTMFSLLAATTTLSGATNLSSATPASATSASAVHVDVSANDVITRLGDHAVGVNTPIWSANLLDRPADRLIRDAGIQRLAFDGGGVSDLYHWRTGRLSPDPQAAAHDAQGLDYEDLKPQFSFDQFAATARATDSSMLVHVNYGTGTPQEAADWVRYANKTRHYGVTDWAIGEETYFNGALGASMNTEPDGHADKSAQAYATNSLAFIKAMKAADPSIRVGLELAAPIPGTPMLDWDKTVLSVAGSAADFVDVHYYTGAQTDAALLASPQTSIPRGMASLRSLVASYNPKLKIDIGETNSYYQQAPQQISPTNALYLPESVLAMLENGAGEVDWWSLYNKWGGSAESGYGDLGLLASGNVSGDGASQGPKADTKFDPYYGMQLLGALARPGARLVTATAGGSVVAHAALLPDSGLGVLLANNDPDHAAPIDTRINGFHAGSKATILTYSAATHRVTETHGSIPKTLPAYSLTLVLLRH
ncbi:Alpha-L-arabinofuranosidase-like protein [Catenulispora acidiphila DSM 44928]|uniref:Alpha-L-arabinofuranosidase-like protein n=1 Tax=Catenulispora acidiphila (strain DSM 44928 / JCM 14897 / NBRC 102108 / NRRL B-24433 / ID139908) TaxID=479433 RepID=C7QK42_CATAD|nr:hypothetical protein [Catenulispora acidiphila]ACU75116.1 Alpha-L-arabinofuranosidase-like protein [Catenulispora acidiphila DSM 44928]